MISGQTLDDEESESVAVWKSRIERNLWRKTGAMPKGPLKRLRESSWAALDFTLLRRQGAKQADAEQIVSGRYNISVRTLWNRLRATKHFISEVAESMEWSGELEKLRKGQPLSDVTAWRSLIAAIGSGSGQGLSDAVDASIGADLMLNWPEEIHRMSDGFLEETIDFLRRVTPEAWRQIPDIEHLEAFAFLVARDITIRNVRTRAPHYCK